MIRAVGWSTTSFSPDNPGRLCRGRERWVTGWEEEGVPEITRLVLSGVEFSDDSARDATRGLTCCGVDVGLLLKALFPDARLVAFKEEGELARIPDYVETEDQWWSARSGGRRLDPCERWRAEIDDPGELRRLVAEDLVDGFLVTDHGMPLSDELEDALFLLTGHGDSSAWPVERFQPLAFATVLQHVRAVICVHLDKHGPAVGVYTLQPIDRDVAIAAVTEASGCLPVPFAIPPMLARWDRALRELRETWTEEREGPFPVPESTEPDPRWGRRRRRRGPREEPKEVAAEGAASPAPESEAEPKAEVEPRAEVEPKAEVEPEVEVDVAPAGEE